MAKLFRATLILCGAVLACLPVLAAALAQDFAFTTLKVGTSYPGA